MAAISGCAQTDEQKLSVELTRKVDHAASSLGALSSTASSGKALRDELSTQEEIGSTADGTSIVNISAWPAADYGDLLGGPDIAYWDVAIRGKTVSISTVVKGFVGRRDLVGVTTTYGYGCAQSIGTPGSSATRTESIDCTPAISDTAFAARTGFTKVAVG